MTDEIIDATTEETQIARLPVTTVDVREASPEGVALMRQRVAAQEEMLKIAVSLTRPSQWAVFGESVYPSGGASDTILRRAFGLTWGPATLQVYENKRGDLEASCTAWLMDGDRRVEQFTGYRQMGGFVKTEPDLRKGAKENMKSVAVRDLLGLRFRTPEEMREMGLDIGGVKARVNFQDNSKHAKSEPGTLTVPFGKNKGKLPSELADKSLAWYTNAARESVDDPAKAQWRDKNEAWLEALEAEQARRAGKARADTREALDGGDSMPLWDEGEA